MNFIEEASVNNFRYGVASLVLGVTVVPFALKKACRYFQRKNDLVSDKYYQQKNDFSIDKVIKVASILFATVIPYYFFSKAMKLQKLGLEYEFSMIVQEMFSSINDQVINSPESIDIDNFKKYVLGILDLFTTNANLITEQAKKII